MRDVNLCLEQATVCQQESESDVDGDTAGAREEDMEEVHAGLPPQLRVTEEQRSHQSEVRLAAAGTELEAAQTEVCSAQREGAQEARAPALLLAQAPDLSAAVMGQLGKTAGEREAGVERCGGDGQGAGYVRCQAALRRGGRLQYGNLNCRRQ